MFLFKLKSSLSFFTWDDFYAQVIETGDHFSQEFSTFSFCHAPCFSFFSLSLSLIISFSLMSSSNWLELTMIYHRIFCIKLITTCWILISGLMMYKNAMILLICLCELCVSFITFPFFAYDCFGDGAALSTLSLPPLSLCVYVEFLLNCNLICRQLQYRY